MNEINEIKINAIEFANKIKKEYDKLNSLVITNDEDLKYAKKEKAEVNKNLKKIEDKRKEIKKIITNPYLEIEKEFKIITTEIKDISNKLNIKISEKEEEEKVEKLNEIKEIFHKLELISSLRINFDLIFNEKMLNKTYKVKNIEEEFKGKFKNIQKELTFCENEKEKEIYLKNLEITEVFEYRKKVEDIKLQLLKETEKVEQEEIQEVTKVSSDTILIKEEDLKFIKIYYEDEEEKEKIKEFATLEFLEIKE